VDCSLHGCSRSRRQSWLESVLSGEVYTATTTRVGQSQPKLLTKRDAVVQ